MGTYAEQEFLFDARDFNLRTFNLTVSATPDEHGGMDETGLLIASRLVDRFQIFEAPQGLRLVLTMDKSYPSSPDLMIPEAKPLETFSVRPPDPEELRIFVRMVTVHYASCVLPVSFGYPAKWWTWWPAEIILPWSRVTGPAISAEGSSGVGTGSDW